MQHHDISRCYLKTYVDIQKYSCAFILSNFLFVSDGSTVLHFRSEKQSLSYVSFWRVCLQLFWIWRHIKYIPSTKLYVNFLRLCLQFSLVTSPELLVCNFSLCFIMASFFWRYIWLESEYLFTEIRMLQEWLGLTFSLTSGCVYDTSWIRPTKTGWIPAEAYGAS